MGVWHLLMPVLGALHKNRHMTYKWMSINTCSLCSCHRFIRDHVPRPESFAWSGSMGNSLRCYLTPVHAHSCLFPVCSAGSSKILLPGIQRACRWSLPHCLERLFYGHVFAPFVHRLCTVSASTCRYFSTFEGEIS